MRIVFLATGTDVATVYLVAAAIVERLGRQKPSTLITSRPVGSPLSENIEKQFGRLWLSGTVYVH